MKKYFLLAFCCIAFLSQAQQPFVTTWVVDSSSLHITIPTKSQYTYNYTVDFGDGTVINNAIGSLTHNYGTAGTYTVSISGTFPCFYGEELSTQDQLKVLTVEQWGDIQWQDMRYMFKNHFNNLKIIATDAPDLSNVTSLKGMFYGASAFNENINHWDVSTITDMSEMFYAARDFNQPLDNWDVSNVTNMRRMFQGGGLFGDYSFNQSLNNWDVSNVTDMSWMFKNATTFNQALNNWNVSNVLDMEQMFYGATDFNQSLNSWDVSNVTTMGEMFSICYAFNQPLNNWDVSNVTNMNNLFLGVSLFNQPLNNWDVSNVTNMESMFRGASSFNQNINNWDVSNVANMRLMFLGADNFNQPLNNWDVSNVLDMEAMFNGAENFNQNINNWDVSSVINMSYTFGNTNHFNQPLNNWNIQATLMIGMFTSSEAFNQNIQNWNVSSVTDMSWMFGNAILFNQPLNNWDVSNVTSMEYMFYNAEGFNQNLNSWDVSNVVDFGLMFEEAITFNQNLSNWNFTSGNLGAMLSHTATSPDHYDMLMEKLLLLNITNGVLGASDVKYCDGFTRQQLLNNGWIIWDEGYANNCDLSYVSGKIIYDVDNNGCDNNDVQVGSLMVNVNDGNNDSTYEIEDNGEYLVGLQPGNYTFSISNLDSNYTSNPASHTFNFTNQSVFEENVDFCLSANQQVEDLAVDSTPMNEALVGAEAEYQVIVHNKGSLVVSNTQIDFHFDASLQSFVSSSIPPTNNTSGLVTFTLNNLEPFSSKVFTITLINANHPILNPWDVLTLLVEVTPVANDSNPNDNTITYDQFVAPIISTKEFDLKKIQFYPNPVKDILTLNAPPSIIVESIRLYDLGGRLIKSFENQSQLDLSSIAQGVYILRLETIQGILNEKIVKR